MARGKHEEHNPNRKVGRSELPRLSGALASLLNNSMDEEMENDEYYDRDPEEGADEMRMRHSMMNNVSTPYGTPISELDASNALQRYRQDRNAGNDTEFYQEDIRDAYRRR